MIFDVDEHGCLEIVVDGVTLRIFLSREEAKIIRKLLDEYIEEL
jgi:hypothetical protein